MSEVNRSQKKSRGSNSVAHYSTEQKSRHSAFADQGRYLMDNNQHAPSEKSGLQASAYSRATSSRAVRRREEAKSMAMYNLKLREAQMSLEKTQHFDRELSPLAKDPANFETRLPNDNQNYVLSPAAKRARQDGSLDPSQTFFNRTFNRKLKMRDTFTKIFPSYTHGEKTCYIPSATHSHHFYPRKNDVGTRMPEIDRTFTHKKDYMKEYSESMLKIANLHNMSRR